MNAKDALCCFECSIGCLGASSVPSRLTISRQPKGTGMTVDRYARDRAAQLLRNFISGRVTNDEFEDCVPPTLDRAVLAIWDTAWVLYDDRKEHVLSGRYRPTADMRRICVRWLLFLHSNHEYEWPDLCLPGIDPATRTEPSFWQRVFHIPERLLTPKMAAEFLAAGHYPVWPFISKSNYRHALRKPRLLSGFRSQ